VSLWVVVGGQYGSEGKGKIAAYIALQEGIDVCVRCGGPNSGHSFQTEGGGEFLVRQVPTAFVNSSTRLLIPAGGLIDLEVLRAEIGVLGLSAARIGIDRNAMVIEDFDREREQGLHLRERLSSTLCGVGAAVARRALRGPEVRLAKDAACNSEWLRELLTDVSREVNSAIQSRGNVLVEGTQGCGLSLYHGQSYPKATSRDTTAAGFISEVGISPRYVTNVVVVFRTFPIRVAGWQAGPIKDEVTWAQIQAESGAPTPLQEMTTVTKKVRRVGRFDWDLAHLAVQLNGPTSLAINGLDYLDYQNRGILREEDLSLRAKDFVRSLEQRLNVPVAYLGTGPGIHQIGVHPATTEGLEVA
jgi:adenylosuccinate synthase